MISSWQGSCSCGATRFSLESPGTDAWMERIVCPCGFCRRTGAWLVADRFGRVRFDHGRTTRSAELAGGSGLELLCRTCGNYLGTLWVKADGDRIALNGRLLDTGAFVFPASQAVVHGGDAGEGLDPDEFPRLMSPI